MDTVKLMMMEGYNMLADKYGVPEDPRSVDWPLIKNINGVLLISLLYIITVKFVGPHLMKNRKAYDLKNIITVYNALQILGCTFLVYKFLKGNTLISLAKCPSVRIKPDDNILSGYWWTMNLKIFELIETVFFVMRKKQSQVSKLHVYHHTSTFLLLWVATKYGADQLVAFYVVLNCWVHIFMYLYYTGAAIGNARLINILSVVKKYITIIQMVQFTIMLLHASQGLMTSCTMPPVFYAVFIPNVMLVFYMFIGFYKKSYKRKIE